MYQSVGKRKSTARPAAARFRHGSTPLRGLLPLIGALLIWELLGNSDSPYFPTPWQWVVSLAPLAENGMLWAGFLATIKTFVVSLLLATVLGATLGVAIGASRRLDRALGPLIEFMRAIPASAMVPVAALILGYTGQMKVIVVLFPTMWPVLLSCRAARKSMSPLLLEVPRTLGLTRTQGLLKVSAPALSPAVLLGVRLAAPLALIITLLVEIVTRIDGLGALLGDAQANFKADQVYALLVIAGALGICVNWLATRGEVAIARRMKGDA